MVNRITTETFERNTIVLNQLQPGRIVEVAADQGIIEMGQVLALKKAGSGEVYYPYTDDAVASQGTLTVDTQPTAGDAFKIGTKEYTFVADGDEANDGDVSIGTDLATAQANIVDAINGDDEINEPNAYATASAFETDVSTITAAKKGTIGDTVETTETFTAGTNVFDGTTLGTETAGVDGTEKPVTVYVGDEDVDTTGTAVYILEAGFASLRKEDIIDYSLDVELALRENGIILR